MDLFEKGISSFFFQDIQGIFQVGEFFVNGVKRGKDVFEDRLFLLQFVQPMR